MRHADKNLLEQYLALKIGFYINFIIIINIIINTITITTIIIIMSIMVSGNRTAKELVNCMRDSAKCEKVAKDDVDDDETSYSMCYANNNSKMISDQKNMSIDEYSCNGYHDHQS